MDDNKLKAEGVEDGSGLDAPSPATMKKKPYVSPVLKVLGRVSEMTRGGQISGADGGSGSSRANKNTSGR